MSRRSLTLVVALALTGILVVVGAFLPVPYVTLAPGPVTNALGSQEGSTQPLITISGHPTYTDKGQLDILTVYAEGDPSNEPTLFGAIGAWIDRKRAIVPEQLLFPPGSTTKDVEQQNKEEMAQSQQHAITAALCYLDLPVTTTAKVVQVEKGTPAAGVLKAGDVVTSVDGQKIGCSSLPDLVTSRPAGSTLTLGITRDGTPRTVPVTTVSRDGRTIVGVSVTTDHSFPFHVDIRLDKVGGPSAGMIFALGVIDKLTPGSLTGGRHVAGTGTIDETGQVGPIGGVQQKVFAAAGAGATVMLVAAGDCTDAKAVKPKGLTLIKVTTLNGAVQALRDLDAGRPVPQC